MPTPHTPTRPPLLRSLQLGRGLAAAAVAAFHLSMATELFGLGRPFDSASQWGSLGVHFFFVLSGFIILQAHLRDIGQPQALATYLSKRFNRIYPIYWLYTTAAVLGMAWVASSANLLHTTADWTAVYVLLKFSDTSPPLAVAWTLFHEVLFYLLFALLIVHRRIGWLALACWIVCIASFMHDATSGRHQLVSVLTGAVNLLFFAGMAAHRLSGALSKGQAFAALAAGLSLCVAATGWFSAEDVFRPLAVLAWATSFALIISGGCAIERHSPGIRIPGLLLLLGDASYSIYLLHGHVQTYALRGLKSLGLLHALPPAATYLLVLAVSLIAGCAAYLCLERPLLRSLRQHLLPAPRARVMSMPTATP